MGYWPSVRSRWLDIVDRDEGWLDIYGSVETKSRSINLQKRTRPISSHLHRTNLVKKGYNTWLSGKFFLRDTAGSPERPRWLHLARSGSQSHRAIWVILPSRGVSRIINLYIQCPLINFHLHMYLDLFDTDSFNISNCFCFLIFRFITMYLLTEWEGRTEYFPVRPDLTQSISILSYDHLLLKIFKILLNLNRTRL